MIRKRVSPRGLSLILLALLAFIFYIAKPKAGGTNLTHDANPPQKLDKTGKAKEPELATGVANVIDTHRTATQPDLSFPKVIYQTSPHNDATPAVLSWYYANPADDHQHFTDAEALKFVRKHYSHAYDAYTSLLSPVARADLFRYFVLHQLGGVYTDIDTTALCPVSGWIPEEFSERDISLVIGIEVDEPTFDESKVAKWGWALNFQFVQWTIMARPGHPALERAAELAIEQLRALAEERKTPLNRLELSKLDLVRNTGPGVFTTAVLEYLGVEPSTFHNLQRPKQVKDVLVLPVTAFAPNQRHSGSKSVSKWESVMEVRVMHGFQSTRSWMSWIKGLFL
ncbi:hypothetical protein BCR37DRAFT_386140 [Protomyces lactucae-debilis]|uniref:Nucleotide-diphospho-sugar transferase n=1 Tax=Protomyces lactucae-debilis TaxID=2754530 RepID=A0A1Y2FL71_PROLT|nr:uncharacterized protein BCR37DRAFT_386140 [Protomyces lactucae-debilis]ORY84751.1 hypothetical protein BCR37DRAFT_386140 [Protomyces lactucae-debilis]